MKFLSDLLVQGDGNEIFLKSADHNISRIIPRGTGANLDKGLFSLFDTGTEDVRIDTAGVSWFNGGNVGIGTTSPEGKLNIEAAAESAIPALGANTTFLKISNSGGAYGTMIGQLSTGDGYIQSQRFDGGNSVYNLLLQKNGGKVGIGTTSPNEKLTVAGNIHAYAPSGINAGLFASTAAGATSIAIRSSGVTFFNAGNVGIGTTSPYGRLNVIPSSNPTTSTAANQISVGESSGNAQYNLRLGYFLEGGAYKGSIQSISGNTPNTLVLNGDGGGVGIGTTNPGTKLHVKESTANILIGADDTYGANYSAIGFGGLSNGHNRIFAGYNGSSVYDDMYYAAGTGKGHQFRTNGSGGTKVIITSAGNVGIGTTAPEKKLHIIGTSSDTAGAGLFAIEGDAGNVSWVFRSTDTGDNLAIDREYGGAGSYYNTLTLQRSTGNVGIGTTAPSYGLDVNHNAARIGSSAQTTTSLYLTATNTAGAPAVATQIIMQGYEGRAKGTFYTDSGNDGEWFNGIPYNGSHNYWQVGFDETGGQAEYRANAKLTIRDNGNVGIGTNSPGSPLDVKSNSASSADSGIRLIANGSTDIIAAIGEKSTNGARFHLYDGGTAKVSFYSDGTANYIAAGNVGIGTTSPGEKLQVNSGNIKIEGGATSSIRGLIIAHTGQTGNQTLLVQNSTNSFGHLYTTERALRIEAGKDGGTGTGETLDFWVNGSERMMIDTTGNVGIGTTSPGSESNLSLGAKSASEGGHLTLFKGTSNTHATHIDNYADSFRIMKGTDASSSTVQFSLNHATGNAAFAGDVSLVDSKKLKIGTGSDIQIFHDTTSSFIDSYNQNLVIRSLTPDKDIIFQADDGSGGTATYFYLDGGSADGTNLYTKFPDSSRLLFGTGEDLQIYHDGSNSYIREVGTGDLYIRANNLRLSNADGSGQTINANNGGNVELFHNNSKKFETTSTGVEVTGKITNLTAGTGNLDAVNVQQLNNATTGTLIYKGTWSAAPTTTSVLDGAVSSAGSIVIDAANPGISVGATITGTGISGTVTVSNIAADGITIAISSSQTIADGTTLTFTTVGGTPDLSQSSRKVTGHYYICETAGAATPNGAGTTPNEWAVGDWATFSDLTTDAWQKIDNSSVLSGAGTGGKVPVWSGTGTSVTLADAPITVSGNNAAFAGDITSTGLTVDYTGNRTGDAGILVTNDGSDWGVKVDKDGTTDYGILSQTDGDNAIVVRNAAGTTNIQLQGDGDATFAGIVGVGSTGVYAGTNAALNLPGKGIALKNDKNGSNNNWSYINNTATAGSSNINFATGQASSALTLAHNGNATFAGSIYANTIYSATNSAYYIDVNSTGVGLNTAGGATFAGNITFGDSHTIGDDGDDNLVIASSASENIIIDSADDIVLDAAGNDVLFKDAGTHVGTINMSSSNLTIESSVSDKDIIFKGRDGTSTITALTLDMSNGGSATFVDDIDFGGKITQTGTGTNTFAGNITGTSAQFIDTTNPDGGGGAGEGGSLTVEGRRDGTANLISLRARDASAPTVALPDGQGGLIRWQGFDGTDFAQMGAISVVADGQAVANSDAPSKMIFYTTPDGSDALTTALTLDKSQNATFAGDITIGSSGASSDKTLNILTGGSKSSVKLMEAGTVYGFSTVYDGATNKFHINRHNNSAAGTSVLSLNRDNDSATFAGTGTFGGQLTVNPNATSSIRIGTAGTNAGLVFAAVGDELYLGANNTHQIRLKTNNDVEFVANATFAGDVTATANYTAGNSKIIYKAQRSGGAVAGDWSYDDATTDMSLGTSTAHSFSLKTGNTRALTINSSQNATFAGNVTLSNTAPILYLANTTSSTGKTWRLSSAANGNAYITQDGVIDAITLSHTSGNATFAGAVDVNGNLTVEDEIHLTDGGSTVRGKLLLNSSDRDNVELRAESLGSTMKFFTVGTEALELDASQNATFAGTINSGTITSTGIVKAATTFQSTGGDMTFYVPNVGEAMRVQQNTGEVGIGTTDPKSKLHVNGGIQMAGDTAAASADKVGTMRYRTDTEYVEVNGTELVTNGDFATDSDWTKEAGWSIASGKASYDASSATNALYQSIGLTTGSVYRLSFTVVNYTSGSFKGHLSNGNATAATDAISANGDYSFNITATGALVLFRNVTSFNGSIDNVSVIEVTAEDASYADMCMQTGASTYEWVNIVRNTY